MRRRLVASIVATTVGLAFWWSLTEPLPVPLTILLGGSPQNTQISTAFANPFKVQVKDAGQNPIPGMTVTFSAPGSGASGTFAGGVNTAVTNASGIATAAAFTANTIAGSYAVTVEQFRRSSSLRCSAAPAASSANVSCRPHPEAATETLFRR